MRSQTDHVVQRKYTVKKGTTRADDKKCYLMSLLNYYGLLGNPAALVCTHKVCGMHQLFVGGGRWIRGVGVELVSLGTHKSSNYTTCVEFS
jgi:hypothetical protein